MLSQLSTVIWSVAARCAVVDIAVVVDRVLAIPPVEEVSVRAVPALNPVVARTARKAVAVALGVVGDVVDSDQVVARPTVDGVVRVITKGDRVAALPTE